MKKADDNPGRSFVVGGLVADGWWLVVGGWWLVVGAWGGGGR